MFFSRRAGDKYFDREPPENSDFDETDLPVGTDWGDLDLSGIVPIGTKLVLLAVDTTNDPATTAMHFRTKGVTYFNLGDGLTTQFVGRPIKVNISIACDSNRVIQVKKGVGSWANTEITVKGWFK